MNIFSRSSALALATAAASVVAAPMSFAGDAAYAGLDNPIRNELVDASVTDRDIAMLTRSQLGELSAVFANVEGAAEQKAAAAAITERSFRNGRLAQPARGSAHAAHLVADVAQRLRAAGIEDVDSGSLSLGTVLRLSLIFSEHDGNQREAARAILEEAPRHARLTRAADGGSAAGTWPTRRGGDW